ncbi:hypothetical protein, partial [uncultured Shewanella sp.]|uniref:hypothetical protein n=1 Tax=uncultured Shewanella sp. TaxID=173975 RepID=UPI00261C399C
SNSEVKRNSADGSVGSPHVRVGHFQMPNFSLRELIKPVAHATGFFRLIFSLVILCYKAYNPCMGTDNQYDLRAHFYVKPSK